MPEILTESFCERCGTRYTFESAAPRKTRRLGQIKTLSKGMKNWVMSDDTSLDEAMAAARNDDDRELTSHQLDAFHATFNFCMTCRQYTCGNCWNTAEGRCLTCAPHLGHEILPAAFGDQAAFEPVRIDAEAWPEAESWPVADLSIPAPATTGNGNGNGLHSDAVATWAATGATEAEDVLDFDPAARLAFLSGETPLPVIEPEESVPATEAATPTAELATPEAPAAEPPTAEVAAFEAPSTPLAAAEAPAPEAPPAPPVKPARPLAAPSFRWPTVDETVATDAIAAQARDVDAAETVDGAPVDPSEQAAAAATTLVPPPPTVQKMADAGANRTADLLRRFRPGQNIDAELAAYEAEADRAAELTGSPVAETPPAPVVLEPAPAAAEPELVASEPPVAAAEPAASEAEPQDVAADLVAAEPEPVVAELVAEPEPVVAEPEPVATDPETPATPAPAPAPTPVWPTLAAEQPREDRIQQPTWQIFAPEATPPAAHPGDGTIPPGGPLQPPFAAAGNPQWPVRPDQVESPAMALLANRKAGSPSDALWAASAREVLAPPASAPAAGPAGVQPCSSCGLSLSATARFCRRCGTRQG